MILILIAVILILSAMSDWADAKDWEASEAAAERRHRELMRAARGQAKAVGLKRAVRRRAIKDASGRVLAEEVILEGGFGEGEEEDLELGEALAIAEEEGF